MLFGGQTRAIPDVCHHATLLWLTSLNVCMRTVSASVDNDPLPSVENPTNNALNEPDIDRLESAKRGILPESLLLSCFALLDDRKEPIAAAQEIYSFR